jgi:hypothetical protein
VSRRRRGGRRQPGGPREPVRLVSVGELDPDHCPVCRYLATLRAGEPAELGPLMKAMNELDMEELN